MSELHDLDATDQARLLRDREVSSVELVTHHLDRVERHGPALGAFVTVTAERALAQAAAADALLAAGHAPVFTGVPTAIKDLTSTAGVRTTMGSVAMRDLVPTVDAHVVRLIQEAGLISLGKTNTPEFGLSSYTDNDLVGPARTPWDLARNAGGSSGGAAAAVAAGLVPMAQGSDGGGSIRIPASSCGIFGFKPSRGRVSAGPSGSDWSGLAVDGPISRTVRDAAALLDVLAHPMPGDLRPLPDPSVPFAEWARRTPGRLRIARWSGTHLDGIAPGPDALEAWEAASRLLESLGHEVVDVANPFPSELEPQFNVIWSSGIAGAPIPPEADPSLRANTRYWRERGGRASAVELARAMQFVEATTREVVTALQPYDAMLTPTLALPPQPVEWFNESGDPVEDHHRELLYTPYTALYNMSGQPAASLPLHWTAEGLPVGVMLAGLPGQDGPLFSLCAQVEAAAPWHDRHPPGFGG
ncbi:amidase [Aeromicrobium endophyticum]|uniref:Amidase n=1 Tax=Aeromicrobium endophyticum TaxID=2292704 RepID=A0A371PBS0_9ACTN|nr:amidase [Aeromicrobium endophyticum]REK73372.1 amidase [Aeromicrobium endophyticum]